MKIPKSCLGVLLVLLKEDGVPEEVVSNPHVIPVVFERYKTMLMGEITKEHLLTLYEVDYHPLLKNMASGLYLFNFNERVILRHDQVQTIPKTIESEKRTRAKTRTS